MQAQAEQIFQVIKPGILTTFQDMGRTGFQRYGVPVSGAMDKFSLQMANMLVGNPRNKACLEITLLGPALEASTSLTVVITGANLGPKLNGKVISMWTSFRMEIGDQLTFGKHQSGVRAYLAVAGGFESTMLFGSQSTDLNSGFGSSLNHIDKIMGYPIDVEHGVGLSSPYIPTYESSVEVAVVEGPHTDCFSQPEITAFFRAKHQVDSSSNRMGYRLNTEGNFKASGSNIWSDAVPFGGIQIPPNGQPIILMADRQTTGGYPRIGTVISTDLSKIAQLIPKGEIKFYPISVEAAQARAVQLERRLTVFAQLHRNISLQR